MWVRKEKIYIRSSKIVFEMIESIIVNNLQPKNQEGTPTIFLEDGRIIPGYQSYEKILAFIKN